MKHPEGTHCHVVRCRSPYGERRIQFLYHYTPGNRLAASDALRRSEARMLSYERQGWRVTIERDVPCHVVGQRIRLAMLHARQALAAKVVKGRKP